MNPGDLFNCGEEKFLLCAGVIDGRVYRIGYPAESFPVEDCEIMHRATEREVGLFEKIREKFL